MNDASDSGSVTAMIRDQARLFAERNRDHKRLRSLRMELPGYDRATAAAMAELGWFGTLIPEQYGGLGLGLADMAALLQELGCALLAEPLASCAVLAARAILHGDAEAPKKRLLSQIAVGAARAALAWQEDFGADPTVCATAADAADRLTGCKRFIAGAAEAAGFVVSAWLTDGIGLFWVSADAPGVSLTQEWRADGTPSGVLVLSEARGERIAGPDCGITALQRALDEGMLMVAAEMLGVMSAALDMTLDYMRTRVQFDRPIASPDFSPNRVQWGADSE